MLAVPAQTCVVVVPMWAVPAQTCAVVVPMWAVPALTFAVVVPMWAWKRYPKQDAPAVPRSFGCALAARADGPAMASSAQSQQVCGLRGFLSHNGNMIQQHACEGGGGGE
jgi:hypothetical protein